MSTLGIGIIGAGRMGRIRALSAQAHPSCRVSWVVDSVHERARALGDEIGVEWSTDWQSALMKEGTDAVVVATTHRHLPAITTAAVASGKHVFCEKPMARQFCEVDAVIAALEEHPSSSAAPKVVVGYTLRHHPAVQKAWQIVAAGEIGDLMYVRGRYGHGGRAGYGQEWRTSPEESGGGEILDQGVHLIDLSRSFLGDFSRTIGFAKCFHWAKERNAVEDNGFMLLATPEEKVAFLHASWTQWKNLFSFEIFGDGGSVIIEGLGGSYGMERLQLIRRQSGSLPSVTEFQYPSQAQGGLDEVWALEWQAFLDTICPSEIQSLGGRLPAASPSDARAVLATVHKLYQYVKANEEYSEDWSPISKSVQG